MARTVVFDGLNLDDLALYFLMPGFDPGKSEPSFDEQVSYAGGVAITNVQPAHIVQLTLPIDVRASSEAAMLVGVEAINAKICACSFAAPKTLIVGSRSFQIVTGAEARPPEDDLYYLNVARLALALSRLP